MKEINLFQLLETAERERETLISVSVVFESILYNTSSSTTFFSPDLICDKILVCPKKCLKRSIIKLLVGVCNKSLSCGHVYRKNKARQEG